jgi:hypothetical protein
MAGIPAFEDNRLNAGCWIPKGSELHDGQMFDRLYPVSADFYFSYRWYQFF